MTHVESSDRGKACHGFFQLAQKFGAEILHLDCCMERVNIWTQPKYKVFRLDLVNQVILLDQIVKYGPTLNLAQSIKWAFKLRSAMNDASQSEELVTWL